MSALDLVLQGDKLPARTIKLLTEVVPHLEVATNTLPRHRAVRFVSATLPPELGNGVNGLTLDALADLEMFDYALVPTQRRLRTCTSARYQPWRQPSGAPWV